MTRARSNVALGVLKGAYGPIHVNAVRSWTRANARAKDEYWRNPIAFKPEPYRRVYRKWTDREIRYLIQKRLTKVPYEKIADHLGRTQSAVQAKADKLGLVNKKR